MHFCYTSFFYHALFDKIERDGTLPRIWREMLLIPTSFLSRDASKGDVGQAFERMPNEVLKYFAPSSNSGSAECFMLLYQHSQGATGILIYLASSSFKRRKFRLCSSGEIYFHEDC